MPDIAAPDPGRALSLAERLVKDLGDRKKTIAAAESCTAGLASHFIASIPGASRVFWGSFVSYAEGAKVKMLGIPEELINSCGAVSRPVALAMAEGALEKSGASWAFSVTGLAGPGGDDLGTPVGTVWVGIAGRDGANTPRSEAKKFLFKGARNELREAAVIAAFGMLLDRIHNKPLDIDKWEVNG